MSGVFVVQEEPTGRWVAMCIDQRCGDLPGCFGEGMHTVADTATKTAAERAATVHRKLLATIPDEAVWPPKPSQCGACGQAKTAITSLQQLVRDLEQRLADATGGEQQ